jgi:hypothetical protein
MKNNIPLEQLLANLIWEAYGPILIDLDRRLKEAIIKKQQKH